MKLSWTTSTWILVSFILASFVMLAFFRPQLRALFSGAPRYNTSRKPSPENKPARQKHSSSTPELLPWNIVKTPEQKDPSKRTPQKSTPEKKQRSTQPFDAFLALDFEGTCIEGSSFDYPNEIIEFPVILMRWKDKDGSGQASELVVVDEFHSFVKPAWKPKLSKFCTNLTGITQNQVDAAPDFVEVLWKLRAFMTKNKLIHAGDGKAITRFCWCTDGPWDLGDLLTKQCFHSRIQPPGWLQNNVIDVRRAVKLWMTGGEKTTSTHGATPNIRGQLSALGLDFQGRLHSGIDDTRNISRVVIELARRGVKLQPNLTVTHRKRFGWMGKAGQVREEQIIMTQRQRARED
ncbi:hypothetical protein VKT23_005460 [Stygiomarasmius scandens]|uniref:Exonuclease domain-containing protein n=1 Tax=Marasmiellus scandens TaxID=2682957 RepID=A0ABR1JUQ8_9AGAR